jgi:hypothetical protein
MVFCCPGFFRVLLETRPESALGKVRERVERKHWYAATTVLYRIVTRRGIG